MRPPGYFTMYSSSVECPHLSLVPDMTLPSPAPRSERDGWVPERAPEDGIVYRVSSERLICPPWNALRRLNVERRW